MDNAREKLIELFRGIAHENCFGSIEKIVDYLIANGVTVLTEDEAQNIYTVQEIEVLQNEAYDLGVDSVLHHKFGLSWGDAAELRKEVARLQVATKWIPVSEKLPERECLCLVAVINDHERRYSKTAWYHGHGNWFLHQKVTHWMPLPEPPKGD